MGKCQSQQIPPEPQISYHNESEVKSSFFNSKKSKDQPNQQFAHRVQQVPSLTKEVRQRLQKLGPFQYEKCGKYSSGVPLNPYKLKNGSIYFGQWHNGKIHGKGKYYLPDHSFFQGISANNQIQGYGRIIHSNGDYFQGQLKDGKANGMGVYVQGQITYKGNFKDNLQDGQGVEQSQLYQFKGLFEDGSKKKGILILKNKEKYEYNGQFKNNRYSGKGVLVNQIGKYEGQFQNGIKNGRGKFTWSDKSYYIGLYVNDQKHGLGQLYDKNNKLVRKGIWEHNIPK